MTRQNLITLYGNGAVARGGFKNKRLSDVHKIFSAPFKTSSAKLMMNVPPAIWYSR